MARPPDARPSAAARGYGRGWRLNSARFLQAHPVCEIEGGCDQPAKRADHYPLSRRDLVAMGDPHPDAWSKLRALCPSHDSKQTAQRQPGGVAAMAMRAPRNRPIKPHPGLLFDPL